MVNSKKLHHFYEGWKLHEDALGEQCIAERTITGHKELYRIHLKKHHKVAYEGYWPTKPDFEPEMVITGACIYSDSWNIQFSGHHSNAELPRPYVIGLPNDRNRIRHFITKKKRPILHIDIPTVTSLYQDILIKWQAHTLADMKSVKKLQYHIPVSIYHGFITEIEHSLDKSLDILHQMLDSYTAILKNKVIETFQTVGISKIEFCDPSKDGEGNLLDAHAADQKPYLDALKHNKVMALEDLAQLTISAVVAKQTGRVIPCLASVLAIPHPMTQAADLKDKPVRLYFEDL